MSLELKVHGPRLAGADPFWTAERAVLLEAAPHDDTKDDKLFDYRAIFVTDRDVPVTNPHRARVPRSFAARLGIRRAELSCPGLGTALAWKGQGDDDAPLWTLEGVLQAHPGDWRTIEQVGHIPDFVLAEGVLPLDGLEFKGAASPPWMRIFGDVVVSTAVAGHPHADPFVRQAVLIPAGLGFAARVRFPWQDAPVVGRWVVSPASGTPDGVPAWRMAPDRAALTPDEREGLRAAFAALAGALQPDLPREPGAAEPRPRWVSLELAIGDDGIPDFFWEPVKWTGSGAGRELEWELVFERTATRLVVESAGAAAAPVATVGVRARTGAGRDPAESLVLEVDAQSAAPDNRSTAAYGAARGERGWDEAWTLKDVDTGLDALETAAWLRLRQGRPTPAARRRDSDAALEPFFEAPPLWGFVPIEDGWAQLPFLNLTDEVYAAAGLGPSRPGPVAPAEAPAALFSSPAVYGNGVQDIARAPRASCAVALLDAGAVEGRISLDVGAANPMYRDVSLTFSRISAQLNGFLHLAADAPTPRDALPDPVGWARAVRVVPLRTRADTDLFPSPHRFEFERLVVRREGAEARPGAWTLAVSDAPAVMAALAKQVPLPAREARSGGETRHAPIEPLVWRRHPRLPMVQALPLTQNAQPPSHPSSSRELAPFILPVQGDPGGGPRPLGIVPAGRAWRFTVEGEGDAAWPAIEGVLEHAREWAAHGTSLPLAVLSLPGLVAVPGAETTLEEKPPAGGHGGTFLPLAYRHDLPALDELNALAAAPREADDRRRLPLLPPPVKAKGREDPLGREEYGGWWTELAEKAFLASADAVDAGPNARRDLLHVVEPLPWPVTATVESGWPGVLRLADRAGNDAGDGGAAAIELRADPTPDRFTALRGVHGHFGVEGEGTADARLRLLDDGDPRARFRLTGGAMHARFDPARGGLRDQRGLWRGASSVATGGFVVTPVRFEGAATKPDDDQQAELWSLLEPLEVTASSARWRLWFRDLPIPGSGAGPRSFDRATAAASDMDVNDPAASTPAKSWQTGYEWRLGQAPAEDDDGVAGADGHPHLELLGLHVYPLTLDAVTVLEGVVTHVQVTARLQLPAGDGGAEPLRALEQTHLSNAVHLVFTRVVDTLRLSDVLVPRAADGGDGEVVWPLRLGGPRSEGGGDARIRWKTAKYGTEGLTILTGGVEFELFGVRTTLPLGGTRTLLFEKPPGLVRLPVPWSFAVAVGVTEVSLTLDPAIGAHSLVAKLLFEWGHPDGLRVRATQDWPIVGTANGGLSALLVHGAGAGREKRLVVDLPLHAHGSGLAERSMRVQWKAIEGMGGEAPLHLFPGMELTGATGCAVLWFDVASGAGMNPPAFTVRGGFAEGLFVCAWGTSLTGPSDPETRLETAFRSSAGHLHVDWTVEHRPGLGWHPGYLLNGWVEVRNLVSWPDDLAVKAPRLTLGGFPHNITSLTTEVQREALRGLARELVAHPDLTVDVEGHASAVDTLADNLKVAQKRAEAVGRFLEANGVKSRRIDVASLGDARTLEREAGEAEEAWHARCRRVELFVRPRVTLPGTLGVARFDHVRHALRILLHQHAVPGNVPRPGAAALLDFGTGAWQFLAVTEHVLARVSVTRTGDTVAVGEIGEIAAWSAVQEVRWCGRQALLGLVDRLVKEEGNPHDDLKAVTLGSKARITSFLRDGVGWQDSRVASMLVTRSGLKDEALDHSLLVEAGAALWLSPRKGSTGGANEPWTVLQYLPDSVLRARLAAPEDFYDTRSPYDERGRRVRGGPWHFVALPFLGRVQARAMDHLEKPVPDEAGALQCDPVLLAARRAASAEAPGRRLRLVLHLTCRAWNAPAEVVMHEFDLRRSFRLDPGSLGTALQRMREPAREPLAREDEAGLAGVMSARAEATPSLAASPAALAAAFSPHRDGAIARAPAAADPLVWRPDALLALQGLVTGSGDTHGFALCAAQVLESLRADDGEPSFPRAAAAATLLPGGPQTENGKKERFPVAFALSPFRRVGLAVPPAADQAGTFVSYAEVLAPPTSPGGGASAAPERLRRVGARAWRLSEPGQPLPDWAEWARGLCAATAPEAPFALVRLREVRGSARGVRAGRLPSDFVVAYRFLVVALGGAPAIAAAGGALRASAPGLRFREGQFGGFTVPGALPAVEVAPPQVAGVQPVWTTDAPSDDAAGAHHRHLSALRFALRYHDDGADGAGGPSRGIVDRPLDPADGGGEAWWATASLQVQWRPGGDGRPELPPRFRARAIGALLPAPPGLPLPSLRELAQPAEDAVLAWQPVLPHGGRVLDTGARPGVPFLFRHSLLTQRGGAVAVASGAVPVQHRSPRPVPLPPNAGDPQRDHQPSAAWFDLHGNCCALREPADNVVHAPAGGGGEALAFRLSPAGLATDSKLTAGLVPAEGAGEFVLDVGFFRQAADGGWTQLRDTGGRSRWSLEAEPGTGAALWISDGRRLLTLGRVVKGPPEQVVAPPVDNLQPGALRLRPFPGDDAAWRNWAGDLPHGTTLTLGIAVTRAVGDGGLTFRQQLRLPLVLFRAGFDLAPLRPAFVQFEDPAYNRRLVSAPLQKEGRLLVPVGELAEPWRAVIASDRQEYDPQAELILAVRVDAEGVPVSPQVLKHVLLLRVDRFGGTRVLRFGPDQLDNLPVRVAVSGAKDGGQAGDVLRFSLAPLGLEPGDTLRVLIVNGVRDTEHEAEMEFVVPIVAEPVVPVPEAAYALLRLDDPAGTAVASCARFAWNPQPSRIDILDPDDLLGRQVRRRAVFGWQDYPAFEREPHWRVQKITHAGSTHIPAFAQGSSAADSDPL